MQYGLLRSDYRRIVENLRESITQAVQIREYRMEFRRDDRTVEGRLVGCTSEYMELNRLSLYRGRFIQAKDRKPPLNVCVISEEIAKSLFPLENPIGQTVQFPATSTPSLVKQNPIGDGRDWRKSRFPGF